VASARVRYGAGEGDGGARKPWHDTLLTGGLASTGIEVSRADAVTPAVSAARGINGTLTIEIIVYPE
jgi:hypothetical protein